MKTFFMISAAFAVLVGLALAILGIQCMQEGFATGGSLVVFAASMVIFESMFALIKVGSDEWRI